MSIHTETSVGEFLDKLTILKLKLDKVEDGSKLENIRKEHDTLVASWNASSYSRMDLDEELAALKKINAELWQMEEDIRAREHNGEFDKTFVRLARAIYKKNDERAAIKKRINEKTGSTLTEEKSYDS
ncbi:MAG: DUF6165 family protein [Gammaproteobacteria bacterium]